LKRAAEQGVENQYVRPREDKPFGDASKTLIERLAALWDKVDKLERQQKRLAALLGESPPEIDSQALKGGLPPSDEAMSPEIPNARETPFAGVARGGVLNVAGAVVSAVVNLAVILVVTRGLSRPEAGAVFGATSLFVLVATAARLGTDATIVHVLAGARALERPEDVRSYLRAALVPVAAISALAGAAVAVAGVHVLHLVARGADVAHGGTLIALVGAAVPIGAVYDVVTAATRGLGRMRPTVVVERLVRPLLQLALVAVAVIAGGGAFAVVCAWIAPYGVAAVAVTRALLRLIPEKTVALSSHATIDFGVFWRFTLPRALAGTIQVALQRLDILLVGALRGAAAAAVYTAATRFVVVGQIGNQAIWYAVQPRLAMLVASRDLDTARRLYRISTAWVIVLTWPLALAVLVASPLVLKAFGTGYSSGTSTMVLMSIALLFSSACGLVDIALITVGKTSWNLWNTALAFVVNIAIDVPLIPRIGIVGAATGWAAAILVRNALGLAQVGRRFGFYPFSRAATFAELGAVVCFAALPASALLAFGHRVSVFGAALGVGTAVYGVQLWRMREQLHLDRLAMARGARFRRRG
jgi:O-antigen/teichoic acid export membrane protein